MQGRFPGASKLRPCASPALGTFSLHTTFHIVICVQNGKGVLSAREFVWWYNGHPDAKDLPIDLRRVSSVAVCGIGRCGMHTRLMR